MKKCLFLLLIFASINCNANNLKLLSRQVDHVDKVPHKNITTKNAMCTASADPYQGNKDKNTTVTGYVGYTISNTTNQDQIYSVDEYMCIVDYGCTHVKSTFQLGAHLAGSNGGVIYTSDYLDIGKYQDEAAVIITGESTCDVESYNTVLIV